MAVKDLYWNLIWVWMSVLGYEPLSSAPWVQILFWSEDPRTTETNYLYLHTFTIQWWERHNVATIDTSIPKGEWGACSSQSSIAALKSRQAHTINSLSWEQGMLWNNFLCPPKFIWWSTKPQSGGIGRRWLGYEGRSFRNRISSPIKETPESSLTLLPHGHLSSNHPRVSWPHHAGILIYDFQPPKL